MKTTEWTHLGGGNPRVGTCHKKSRKQWGCRIKTRKLGGCRMKNRKWEGCRMKSTMEGAGKGIPGCCPGSAGPHLLLTCSTGMLRRLAMSSTVSLVAEMMPTLLAMALAVMGWSPVTIMTWARDKWVTNGWRMEWEKGECPLVRSRKRSGIRAALCTQQRGIRGSNCPALYQHPLLTEAALSGLWRRNSSQAARLE